MPHWAPGPCLGRQLEKGVPLVLMCPQGVLDGHWGTLGNVRRGSVVGHCGGLLIQREAGQMQNLQSFEHVLVMMTSNLHYHTLNAAIRNCS